MTTWMMVLLAGCGTPPAPKAEPKPVPAAPEPPPPPPAPAAPEWKVLAPSPLALEAEVRASGVSDGLAALVPEKRPDMPPPAQKDRVAFRTGVVFSYTLLGGRAAKKPALVGDVTSIRDGMATIGTGKGLLTTMDQAIEQLKNDTASREDFLTELDAQVASSVPSEGWGPEDSTGPMLQAGAWLAGTNLVAKAVVAKDDPDAAQKLLRRPEVPAFFLKYISSGEGEDKAGKMAGKVAETLTKLEAITSKPKLDKADAQAIADATDALLQLL